MYTFTQSDLLQSTQLDAPQIPQSWDVTDFIPFEVQGDSATYEVFIMKHKEKDGYFLAYCPDLDLMLASVANMETFADSARYVMNAFVHTLEQHVTENTYEFKLKELQEAHKKSIKDAAFQMITTRYPLYKQINIMARAGYSDTDVLEMRNFIDDIREQSDLFEQIVDSASTIEDLNIDFQFN